MKVPRNSVELYELLLKYEGKDNYDCGEGFETIFNIKQTRVLKQ